MSSRRHSTSSTRTASTAKAAKAPRATPAQVGLICALLVSLAGCVIPEAEPPTQDTPEPDPTPGGLDPFKVVYVDVGQGDGTIWVLPDGGAVIYDCGPAAGSPDENEMVQALRSLGFSAGATLSALISSHGHLDHIGGCQEILSEYHVEHLYESWYDGDDRPKSYQRFQDELLAEVASGATLHVVGDNRGPAGAQAIHVGDTIEWTEHVSAEVLWPMEPTTRWDRVAEHSLVLRVTHGSIDYCFQGDIEDNQEADLAQSFGSRDCDVYLVGHHGSRYASSTSWLQAMAPQVAIASVGDNSYGHPHPDATGRLAALEIPLHTTKGSGTISVTSNGEVLSIRTERTPDANPEDTAEPNPSDEGPDPDAWVLEVNADPPGADRDNLEEEWVLLRNPLDSAIDLTGWTLQDAVDTAYDFPEGFTLPAGSEVRVRTGTGTDTGTDLYWNRASAVWNNSGDVAVLYDHHGVVVDEFAY